MGVRPVKSSNKTGRTSGSGTAKRPAATKGGGVKAVKSSKGMKGHA